jgi:N-acyl-D-aspartate/D-glutamate deacylase
MPSHRLLCGRGCTSLAAKHGGKAGGSERTGLDYDLIVRNGYVVDGTGLPRRRADLPGGVGRYKAYGRGVHATIANGVPIVLEGELTGRMPGRIVAPQ